MASETRLTPKRVRGCDLKLERVGGGLTNATKVLQHDYLLSYILDCVVDECGESRCQDSEGLSVMTRYEACVHDTMFLHFICVSKQWFRVAVPYIWRLTNYSRLKILLQASQENGVRASPSYLFINSYYVLD